MENKSVVVRLGICGDWLDHPTLNSVYPGSVINASIIFPNDKDAFHGGLSTSTSKKARELWGNTIPKTRDKFTLAKSLFAMENMPDVEKESHMISGSQDAFGIVFPGINNLHYDNGYLPNKIDTILDKDHISWMESVLYLIPTHYRDKFYRPIFDRTKIKANIGKMVDASELCWQGIVERDTYKIGMALNHCRSGQSEIIPNMYHNAPSISDVSGWKYSGGGGGGYIVAVSDKIIENAIKIKIRTR